MKRIISSLMAMVLTFCFFGSYSSANAADDIPYSGGSGTEGDPYLISTEEDIKELRDTIKRDPSLWYTKHYYKLTNDIETSYDLYVESCTDKHSTSSFQLANTSESYYKERLVPIYADRQGEDIQGGSVHDFCSWQDKYNYVNKYFWQYMGESDIYYISKTTYYWNAAFTGVFDGNGHTIKLNKEGYFFGFIENDAVVKDLTVEGEEVSLAYCLDDTSFVINSNIKASPDRTDIKYKYGKQVDGITGDGFAYTVTENSEVYISALLEYGDAVVIPEAIEGMPVVGIDEQAFTYKYVDIESLYIHKGIADISTYAFGPDWNDAKIGTIYYDGTAAMLSSSYYSEYNYSAIASRYNVVYADSVPIEGFVLKNGETTITLKEGQSFRPEYECYPENARGRYGYSFENKNIVSVKKGLITAHTPGETTVTVIAESGVRYTFNLKVIGVTGIAVEKLPDKTYYSLRHPFDSTGLRVVKLYNDGTREECTDFTLSSYNVLQKGIQTITVTSESFTTSFDVFVSGAMVGDVDLDGVTTAVDSNYLKRIIVGNMTAEEYTDVFFACDMNSDGEINAVDSALLRRSLAGE